MSTINHEQWLDLLQRCCEQAGSGYLYLIIDQAGSQLPLLASVRSVVPALRWHSLYSGLPENAAEQLAPLLVGVDLQQPLQRHWLTGLLQALHDQQVLLALVSLWPFESLAEQLSGCLHATQGGCAGLLRYHDPRLFAVLLDHVLDPAQQQRWLQPAVIWSWLDRDGIARHRRGAAAPPESTQWLAPTELSDSQMEKLDCASDAVQAMADLVLPPGPWSHERLFQDCYAAMCDATEAGLITDSQRIAFACERLGMPMTEHPSESKAPAQ